MGKEALKTSIGGQFFSSKTTTLCGTQSDMAKLIAGRFLQLLLQSGQCGMFVYLSAELKKTVMSIPFRFGSLKPLGSKKPMIDVRVHFSSSGGGR